MTRVNVNAHLKLHVLRFQYLACLSLPLFLYFVFVSSMALVRMRFAASDLVLCRMVFSWMVDTYKPRPINFIVQQFFEGAQWLSGRELDSRAKGRGFEPHRRHCVVVFEQDTFILA